MTQSFWFTLSSLSVCYGSEISINPSKMLKPGLIFTHLNTTPHISFSLIFFLTIFLSFRHTLKIFLSLKIQILCSLGVNGTGSAVFSMICNRITAVMSGSLWQQQGGIFTVPCKIQLTLRAVGACLPAGAVIWLTDAKHLCISQFRTMFESLGIMFKKSPQMCMHSHLCTGQEALLFVLIKFIWFNLRVGISRAFKERCIFWSTFSTASSTLFFVF